MNDALTLCVFGRPGSGKDTQALLLAQEFNLVTIKTSTLLVEKFQNEKDNSIVQEQKKIYDAGGLVDPHFIVLLIKEHITYLIDNKFHSKNGIIFTGSPRTLYESEQILPFLTTHFSKERVLGVYLDVNEEECINRIIKRNARALDRDRSVLDVRMREFDERTVPAIEYFRTHGTVLDVDGMGTEKEVFVSVKSVLAPLV